MIDLDTIIDSGGLYQSSFPDGSSYTFRLLTLKEYRIFMGLRRGGVFTEQMLAYEAFKRCFVGNVELLDGNLPAGIPISIGSLILYWSGDCQYDTLIQDISAARENYNFQDVYEVMKRICIVAFEYSPEEIEGWTRPTLLKRFVEAEAMLVFKMPNQYTPLDLKKIQFGGEKVARQTIDIEAENRALGRATTAKEAKEARDLTREELRSIRNKRAQHHAG